MIRSGEHAVWDAHMDSLRREAVSFTEVARVFGAMERILRAADLCSEGQMRAWLDVHGHGLILLEDAVACECGELFGNAAQGERHILDSIVATSTT